MTTKYRVAKVISNRKLVITGGMKDGIQHGDEFWVVGYGEEIEDPETGEKLDKLQYVRGKGHAVHVQQRITTIESNLYRSKPKSPRTISPLLLSGLMNLSYEEHLQPFDEAQVGDHVIPVKKEPAAGQADGNPDSPG